MKTKAILTGMVMLLSATAWTANAQDSDQPAIKILPAAEEGKLKLVYARSSQKAVNVKFIGENGLLTSDRISAGSFDKGFIKKYDISRIQGKTFWVEVSSADLTVRYKLVESKDGKSFVPYLEQTTYNHQTVATIN